MRTWGRIGQVDDKGGTWVEVSTTPAGDNTAVYLTSLIQVLKLNLGESPFFGNFGIPAQQSLIQQIQPDYYVSLTQQYFAPFFAALLVSKVAAKPNQPKPTYDINITPFSGSTLAGPVAT